MCHKEAGTRVTMAALVARTFRLDPVEMFISAASRLLTSGSARHDSTRHDRARVHHVLIQPTEVMASASRDKHNAILDRTLYPCSSSRVARHLSPVSEYLASSCRLQLWARIHPACLQSHHTCGPSSTGRALLSQGNQDNFWRSSFEWPFGILTTV